MRFEELSGLHLGSEIAWHDTRGTLVLVEHGDKMFPDLVYVQIQSEQGLNFYRVPKETPVTITVRV